MRPWENRHNLSPNAFHLVFMEQAISDTLANKMLGLTSLYYGGVLVGHIVAFVLLSSVLRSPHASLICAVSLIVWLFNAHRILRSCLDRQQPQDLDQ